MKVYLKIGMILAGIWFLLTMIPLSLIHRGPELCLFKKATGLECYGCGMTRGLFHLLHGDIQIAIAYNPLAPVVLSLLLFIIAHKIFRKIQKC